MKFFIKDVLIILFAWLISFSAVYADSYQSNTASVKYSYASPPISYATDNMTMSAWIKWNGMPYGNQSIFYNGSSDTSGYGFYVVEGSSKIKVLLGGVATLTSSVDYPVNSWVNVTAVREFGLWKLYVNGVMDPWLTSDAGGLTVSPNTPTRGTFQGTNFNLGAEPFSGDVYGAFIVDSALSPIAIRSLSQANVENAHRKLDRMAFYSGKRVVYFN